MGFGGKWVSWIGWCLSATSFSVLVNGSSVGFFQSSRGLRQGDPLSPYLFVLRMVVLSRLISRAVEGGFLSSCRFGGRTGEGLVVSHLLFVDDTILFCDIDLDQMAYLGLLMWFETISGLKINLSKSEIILVGGVTNVESLARELGCRIGALPTSYLGLPLGAPHNSVLMWDVIEERFRKRLSLWKRQFLSKGGRLTLMHNTLMSLFKLPKKVNSVF